MILTINLSPKNHRIRPVSHVKTRLKSRGVRPGGFFMDEQMEHNQQVCYFLECENDTWKIGRSTWGNVENRVRTVLVSSPLAPRNCWVFEASSYLTTERRAHRSLLSCRIRGEWFDDSDDKVVELLDEYIDLTTAETRYCWSFSADGSHLFSVEHMLELVLSLVGRDQ